MLRRGAQHLLPVFQLMDAGLQVREGQEIRPLRELHKGRPAVFPEEVGNFENTFDTNVPTISAILQKLPVDVQTV